MTYEDFKQLANGKTYDEVVRIIDDNLIKLDLRSVYYNTYKIFTSDNYELAKGGDANNSQAGLRLLDDAYKLTSEYAEFKDKLESLNVDSLCGKKIWGKEIVNATSYYNKIAIVLEGGRVYKFSNIDKLKSLIDC